jgi:glycosyltransferase involved in cell wall biosynthesis
VLIEAFRIVKDTVKNTELTIVGGGKEKERLKKLSQKLDLNNCINFTGQLKMENYLQELNKADVVVNPCFREGSVTVSFDSMSYNKPLICFDSGGYTHYFNEAYSIVLKDIQKRDVAIQKLADAMIKLSDKGVAQEMGRLSYEAGKLYSWKNKGLEIYKIVQMKYQEYNNGK